MAKKAKSVPQVPAFKVGDLVKLKAHDLSDSPEEYAKVLEVDKGSLTCQLLVFYPADDGLRDGVPFDQVEPVPELTPGQREALRLLHSWTAGNFDVWSLQGPGATDVRQKILSALVGRKQPKGACGVNNIRSALFQMCGVEGDSLAADAAIFKAWAAAVWERD